VAHLAAQQRDVEDRLGVDVRGEEADDAQLAGQLAGEVVELDADIIEVGYYNN
jgi:hypothetical protein